MLSDLRTYLTVASKVLPGTAAAALEVVEKVDPRFRVSSGIYVAHHDLRTGLVSQSPSRVAGAANRITAAARSGTVYASGFEVRPLPGDVVDEAMIDAVMADDGPRDPEGRPAEVHPATQVELMRGMAWAAECLPIMEEVGVELFGEFQTLVNDLHLFAGANVRGVTSVRCYGRILLRLPDEYEVDQGPLYFLDHITHETSHLSLHGIMNVDPLILNGFSARFSAPIRPDARPLYGIFHAVYVLSRITRVFARVHGRDGDAVSRHLRDLQHRRFKKDCATIDKHGDLNDNGRLVLESCRELVEDAMG